MQESSGQDGFLGILHRDVWSEEHLKCYNQYGELINKDNPFHVNDYTLVPRGRVTLEKGAYILYIGDWVKEYPEVVDLVEKTFKLENCDFSVLIDEHWNIGRGWSE